jgi:hypothetical protein
MMMSRKKKGGTDIFDQRTLTSPLVLLSERN